MQVSVVLPVFNEDQVLPLLYQKLKGVLSLLPHETEIVFINDGSSDGSVTLLKQFQKNDPNVRIISFARNFGHQMAISAGLRYAQGDVMILMDTDLQDPPELIPQLLSKNAEGWDVVYAVRKARKESRIKRLSYNLFYQILHKISLPHIPVDAGDFCLINRRVVALINRMPERTRFVRGLRSWVGLKQTKLEYERDTRFAGCSKYSWWKLVLLALDGMVAFSYAPLRIASFLGLCCSGLAAVGILIFVYLRLFTPIFIPGWTSIIIAVFFMGSVQLITAGILGEYVARIYEEVKHRPLYIIDEMVGFPAP